MHTINIQTDDTKELFHFFLFLSMEEQLKAIETTRLGLIYYVSFLTMSIFLGESISTLV
jgi:hypothetical protein